METLLEIRKSIKDFFDRYDLYLIPCLKFLLAFFTFVMISRTLPYFGLLNNVFILVILALLCAILPVNSISVTAIILIILQCFAASLIIGMGALCFFVLLIILLVRFVPSDMLAVILTPFAFMLNLAAVIPVALGMLRHRSSVAAGVGGVAVYCFLSEIPAIAVSVRADRLSAVETVKLMVSTFTGHKELILSAIVFAAVILIVNIIRRMVTSYTYLTAALAGCAFYLILRMLGRQFLDVEADFLKELIGTLLSALICLVIAFFVHNADYRRTQMLQFEDDQYYYYVKAVPKRTPDTPDAYDEEEREEYEEYYEDLGEEEDEEEPPQEEPRNDAYEEDQIDPDDFERFGRRKF